MLVVVAMLAVLSAGVDTPRCIRAAGLPAVPNPDRRTATQQSTAILLAHFVL